MKTWTVAAFLSTMSLCLGCWHVSPGDDPPGDQAPAEYYFEGKIILGSPSLTAGIPGSGPLTIDQICQWLEDPKVHQALDFTLPLGLRDAATLIWMPPDNQLTRAKIELGRQIFFDAQLSNHNRACALCHRPEQDYSAYMVMPRVGRNPPVCFNRIFSEHQFWDGRANSLEDQVSDPISNPFEMGTPPEEFVANLKSIEGYQLQFDAIFGRTDMETVGFALASFQRALVTGPAPWDYHRLLTKFDQQKPESLSPQEKQLLEQLRAGALAYPMSESALRGEGLFFSERTKCHWCHSGPNLTDEMYHNIGVGMDLFEPDLGRFEFTKNEEDLGAFKTPTLRNIANTPPYMHDGKFGSLIKVIDWFNQGGVDHAHLDAKIQPLDLAIEDRRDLIAFLNALSGPLPPVESARLPQADSPEYFDNIEDLKARSYND
ncbi:MAG: cytochrome c peroxidase [Pirellulales bacterium]